MNFGSPSSDAGRDDNYNEDTFNKHRDPQCSDSVHMAEYEKVCSVQIRREQPSGPSMVQSQPYALGSLRGCTGHYDSHDRCLVAACVPSGLSALHTAEYWVYFFIFFNSVIWKTYIQVSTMCKSCARCCECECKRACSRLPRSGNKQGDTLPRSR